MLPPDDRAVAPAMVQHPPERRRHLALCLPLAGLFLLMPPAIMVVGLETAWLGFPLTVLYIFGVWVGLIFFAAMLARSLEPSRADPPQPNTALSPDMPAFRANESDSGPRS